MDHPVKTALIDKFESAYGLVEKLVQPLTAKELHFAPSLPEAWSINDHLVHLLDAEISTYFRLRLALAEPGSKIQVWDEIAWQGRLGYAAMDGLGCLKQAMALRQTLAAYLRTHLNEDWSGYWLMHPERGRLGVEDILEIYREHLSFHVPYIKRNLEALKA